MINVAKCRAILARANARVVMDESPEAFRRWWERQLAVVSSRERRALQLAAQLMVRINLARAEAHMAAARRAGGDASELETLEEQREDIALLLEAAQYEREGDSPAQALARVPAELRTRLLEWGERRYIAAAVEDLLREPA